MKFCIHEKKFFLSMLIMFFLFLFLSKKSQKIVFLYTFIVKAMKIKYLQAKKGIQIILRYTD